MKSILFSTIFFLSFSLMTLRQYAQVAINDDQSPPDLSAMLDVKSNSRGLLVPRMSYSEMHTIVLPAHGLIVFCTSVSQYYLNKGTPSSPEWTAMLALPYAGTYSSTTTLLDITNTGSAGVGSFSIANDINPSEAMRVQTSGMGPAARFIHFNPFNISTVISAEAISGNAIIASNASSTHATVWLHNAGTSTGIYDQSSGGNALYAINASPAYYTIWAENDSTGPVMGLSGSKGFGLYAENNSDSNSTIFATNNGSFTAFAALAQTGHALYTENSSPVNHTIWARNKSTGPVFGLNCTTGNGIYAENSSNDNSTVYAKNNGSFTTIAAIASEGNALFAENESSERYTIWAQNNADGPTLGLNSGIGNTLFAQNNSSSQATIYASNSGSFTTLAAVATSGNSIYALNSSNLYSTLYVKNNATEGTNAIYAENSSTYPAILGSNLKTSGDRSGGYFSSGTAYAWVGAVFSGTSYKITGTGSVATIASTPSGEKVSMFCPESPEILLSDHGAGKLNGGSCHITLDPVFTNNIVVDEHHPLKVFIQMEGDCKGVYVTKKSAEGFDVKELMKGTSDVPFSWMVVASRCDEKDARGRVISKNTGVRFPKAPVQGSFQ
ncbi:MAG: hypothetical protein PHP04_08535 [Bacteroidales bacterium]|nr:hypothetical protein [Bacteroidales bacterium]